MDGLIQIAQIFFILSVLIILHEFGHYIPAKIFKVRVEKFYLFMDVGFSLFKKKIKETEWGIGWLPIGGYVKLSGMIDESMDAEQMNQEPQPWEFRSKKPWQRLIIMLGGVTVNIVLAIAIYTIMYATVGQKIPATARYQQNGLTFDKSGLDAGFKDGDKILSVDGKYQEKFNRMVIDVLLSDKVEIERNGKKQTLIITDEQKSKILGGQGRAFMQPRLTNVIIDSVLPKSPASTAGLQKGDKIVAVNGFRFKFYDELIHVFEIQKSKAVKLVVVRNNQEIEINTSISADGKLGFHPTVKDKLAFIKTNNLSVAQAIPAALDEAYTQFIYNIKQFKLILRPKTEAYKHVKSPIGITRMLPTEWDWEFVWTFTAMFSIGLAFMNLLPIPGLDGGHALFTIAEMITGKTLSIKNAERVQTVGMFILLSLMALTFGKDIYQLILDKFLLK